MFFHMLCIRPDVCMQAGDEPSVWRDVKTRYRASIDSCPGPMFFPALVCPGPGTTNRNITSDSTSSWERYTESQTHASRCRLPHTNTVSAESLLI